MEMLLIEDMTDVVLYRPHTNLHLGRDLLIAHAAGYTARRSSIRSNR